MARRRWLRHTLTAAGALVLIAGAAAGAVTKSKAHQLVLSPAATRSRPHKTPADYHMPYENVHVRTPDGLNLVGWWVPPARRGLVMIVPGYRGHRGQVLGVAEVLYRHGYGLLDLSVRAQDGSDGELISFGVREASDVETWLRYARARLGDAPTPIGMLGVSLGGHIAINVTAIHPEIAALVADCAFSSVEDTIATSVRHFTNLPPFPFAPMLLFWMEREAGFTAANLDARLSIGRIGPRPVLVMQGGADTVISPTSGQQLYDAARDPKEFWFEPAVEHAKFFDTMPQEYERRVTGFFDKYLVSDVH